MRRGIGGLIDGTMELIGHVRLLRKSPINSSLQTDQTVLTSISAASVTVSSTVGMEIALFTIESAFNIISVS